MVPPSIFTDTFGTQSGAMGACATSATKGLTAAQRETEVGNIFVDAMPYCELLESRFVNKNPGSLNSVN
jgi:hypothetical protein